MSETAWRGDEQQLESRAQLVGWFEKSRRPGAHMIGTEQEKFGVYVDADGMPQPVRYREHVLPTLEAMRDRFGWTEAKDRGIDGELIALERDGASITLEPGGQFELSGKPLPTVHDTCAEFTTHYRELDEISRPLGVAWLACGFHPFATREEVDSMPKGRYAVMREYLPTRGKLALDMMLRTCTVQANFDYRDEAQCAARFRVLLGTSSLMTALFANSPYEEGKFAGMVSRRSATWEQVDPDRCGLLPFVFEGPDQNQFTWEKYVDFALDVPMFFVKRGHHYHPHHVTFRRYMADGFTDPSGQHHRATQADWEVHLSTLFPEVRLKPFLEVRGEDSINSSTVCALPALCKGIIYDDDACAAAWELVAPLDFGQRMDLWRRARTHGLADPEVLDMCQRLLLLARAGLERLDVRDSKGRTEARFLESLEKQVERHATPANDALARLGEAPGRSKEGRRALVEYFTFAGALPPASVLNTTENEVGKARWRTVREDGQWSRTLDEVILVLAKRSPLSAQSVHSQRLDLRKHCGDRLNGHNPDIAQRQTDDDLEAGLEVGVLNRTADGLWRIEQDWWGKLDNEAHAAVAAFADCEPGK